MLENFNAFSQILHLDFNIPLPHILLPLALSFVTFQQIAFLYDCYKIAKGESKEVIRLEFIDYALFISFFPQLIAGPIVHHKEMIPQFAKIDNSSLTHCHIELCEISKTQKQHFSKAKQGVINYEFLAKGIFIFCIGLFKKVFIADSFAKWANAGFSVVENGQMLNIFEAWATSLSYTFQLYFDFSGYCDMAIGLGLMFGIVLPINFNSPYKALNIAEFWRKWHITLGRFFKECVYIPLGGNRGKNFKVNSPLGNHCVDLAFLRTPSPLSLCKNTKNSTSTTSNTRIWKEYPTNPIIASQSVARHLACHSDAKPKNPSKDYRNFDKSNSSITVKILTLRNLFIVAFLSGIWHGAGWGFVIWGILHGVAMVIHRIYSWWLANSSLNNHCVDLAFSPHSPLKRQKIHKQTSQLICHSEVKPKNPTKKANSNKQSKFIKVYCNFTQTKLYKCLCWFVTFHFINLTWVFFRAENLSTALNVLKAMFGFGVSLPEKWHRMPEALALISGRNETVFAILIAFVLCLAFKNSIALTQNLHSKALKFSFSLRMWGKKIYYKGGDLFVKFIASALLFALCIKLLLKAFFDENAYSPFLYFNF